MKHTKTLQKYKNIDLQPIMFNFVCQNIIKTYQTFKVNSSISFKSFFNLKAIRPVSHTKILSYKL
jgi:hypothetical protein